MDVEHGLTRAGAGVEDKAEIAVGLLRGDRVRQSDEFRQEVGVARGEFDDVAVLLRLRDHQQVDRRLGGDVADGERVLCLGDDLGRDLALQDAGEHRRLAHGPSLSAGYPGRRALTSGAGPR